ncbi:DUF3865 domain-containing protein [Xenorhabdus bovienii]|uniref:DUF3865 domain-containing protein n=1 Tax=Xenorhabdus bovienii TaxID=40576 RepID=UPI0023B2D285|nr:DUF3865 domain-containing protein [Xenorhabdus bovienii]MDE9482827.1 DUF3865 domain-containing protein [Xenorhabdus bovienii]MDE9544940.1 DUF3865 domain-containing protein [Xenorhabdus bovienii]MDE9553074.1 DUF3865 domain-containing protein [Xenorhabdus bovienii]
MYRNFPALVDDYLNKNISTGNLINSIISEGKAKVDGSELIDKHFDPMIAIIYNQIKDLINPSNLSQEEAKLYIGELSVFARYNSTMLLRAADNIRGFCPEFAQELTRNFLEEGGERGKLPAHYVVFSGALIADVNFRVNGWMPRTSSTRALISLIDILTWSHCPSTVLGMYYATEAIAIAETLLLQDITNRLGQITGRGTGNSLKKLDFYYRMHLDETHSAATDNVAVERGHQEGIARFIRDADLFHFQQPQIVDGFLQMLTPFVDQWVEIHHLTRTDHYYSH